jgi:hypothetical protein
LKFERYKYLDCFRDDNNRVLPKLITTLGDMTVDLCIVHCNIDVSMTNPFSCVFRCVRVCCKGKGQNVLSAVPDFIVPPRYPNLPRCHFSGNNAYTNTLYPLHYIFIPLLTITPGWRVEGDALPRFLIMTRWGIEPQASLGESTHRPHPL